MTSNILLLKCHVSKGKCLIVFQKLEPTNLMLFVQDIYKKIESVSIDINYLELALF